MIGNTLVKTHSTTVKISGIKQPYSPIEIPEDPSVKAMREHFDSILIRAQEKMEIELLRAMLFSKEMNNANPSDTI